MDAPGPPPGTEFEVISLELAYSSTVENMILDFDKNNPINPGEIYYSPIIPQLENRIFSVREFNFNGPYVYVGGTILWREVVLDNYYLSKDPWNGWFGATLRFHSVPDPEIVPVPSAVILGSLGLTFSGWMLKRKRML